MKKISKTDQRKMYKMFKELTKDYINTQNTFSLYSMGMSVHKDVIAERNKNVEVFKSFLEDDIE